MRIVGDKKGNFHIDDSPMVLRGAAAREFLDRLDHPEKYPNPIHDRVLNEIRKKIEKEKSFWFIVSQLMRGKLPRSISW